MSCNFSCWSLLWRPNVQHVQLLQQLCKLQNQQYVQASSSKACLQTPAHGVTPGPVRTATHLSLNLLEFAPVAHSCVCVAPETLLSYQSSHTVNAVRASHQTGSLPTTCCQQCVLSDSYAKRQMTSATDAVVRSMGRQILQRHCRCTGASAVEERDLHHQQQEEGQAAAAEGPLRGGQAWQVLIAFVCTCPCHVHLRPSRNDSGLTGGCWLSAPILAMLISDDGLPGSVNRQAYKPTEL